jgi:hypothetical protein
MGFAFCVLIGLAIFLLVAGLHREGFAIIGPAVDEKNVIARPTNEPNSVWRSKVESGAPLESSTDDYIMIIQRFYDEVYAPMPTPKVVKDSDIQTFVETTSLPGGVEKNSLRKILGDGFHAASGDTAAARELKGINFTPSENIQPEMGVDEVFVRKEEGYVPVDPRGTPLSEGDYAPLVQQEVPRHAGYRDYRTTSWTSTKPYDICESGDKACTENVL